MLRFDSVGPPRACSGRTACVLALLILPLSAIAGAGTRHRTLSDKLRHGPGVVNHPVHVIPSAAVKIPQGWPLAADGALTCTTCHTALPSLGGGNVTLRGTGMAGPAFCASCHEARHGRAGTGMHWQALVRAHASADSDDRAVATAGMDPASHRCLSCHDGVNAPEAAYQTPFNRDVGSVGDRRRNHPVGVAYPHAGRRRAEVPLRPRTLLPAAVRLPGGQVSCLSCHDLYNRKPRLLSVPIEGSRLCLSCHELD